MPRASNPGSGRRGDPGIRFLGVLAATNLLCLAGFAYFRATPFWKPNEIWIQEGKQIDECVL